MAIATDKALPNDLRVLAADAHDAVEVEAAALRTGRALIALEDLGKLVETRAKQIREALLSLMVDGLPPFNTGTHTISFSETRRVHVTDLSALPAEYRIQPPEKADTQALGDALRRGDRIAGAELGNGVPTLTVRASRRS